MKCSRKKSQPQFKYSLKVRGIELSFIVTITCFHDGYVLEYLHIQSPVDAVWKMCKFMKFHSNRRALLIFDICTVNGNWLTVYFLFIAFGSVYVLTVKIKHICIKNVYRTAFLCVCSWVHLLEASGISLRDEIPQYLSNSTQVLIDLMSLRRALIILILSSEVVFCFGIIS